MNGSLSCPRCHATGIPLGAVACPACHIGFAQPVAVATTASAPPMTYHAAPHSPLGDAEVVQYASMGARFLAGVVDTLILAVPFTLLFGWGDVSDSGWTISTGPADLFQLVVTWLYYAMLQASSERGTIGMRIMGLQVLRAETFEQISFARATGRHFASYISAFILLIGYIMIWFTARKQALHDMIADVIVVKRVG